MSRGRDEERGALESVADRVSAACADLELRAVETRDGMPCFEVGVAAVADFMTRLAERCGFETVIFVTAIDHAPRTPRFEVNYQLLSIEHGDRVRVVVPLDEADASVPSITGLWVGASFFERECYDMFGITFEGHPDLRRLLMPDAYEHYPLRKDFPHQGIEPDRLYREWERARGASAGS